MLDNALYYLLNQFDSETIKGRLIGAAEVHPNEIARRIARGDFKPPSEVVEEQADVEADDRDLNSNKPQRVGKRSSKLEQAKRLLGG